jgi:hypothetical protein
MDVCVKVGKELASDLYQELFVILCDKDDTWIEEKNTIAVIGKVL